MLSQKTIKLCKVLNYNIAYHREGSGEIILLIHGITTYSFIWRNIIPLLSKNYDVIALDLLGCGESDKPLNIDYSLKNHSQLLKEFVTVLGINKFHLVGHDLGGGIAQIFAVNYPELLIDLTLINTVAYDFWPVQPIIAMRTPIVRQLAMASLDFGMLKLLVKRGIYHKKKVTPELMDYFSMPMKTKEGRKAFLHFAKSLNNQNLLEIQDDIRKLKMPVLIIRGDADLYLSLEISLKLNSEIPNSKLIRINTASHFIQEDEPVKVTGNIIAFYKGNFNETKS